MYNGATKTKMGYWHIMVNMPDERIGQHTDEQMGAKQWSGESSHPSQRAPAGLGLSSHPPWGQAPGPQSSVHMTVHWWIPPPRWGVRADGLPSQLTPWLHIGWWLPQVACQWSMAGHFPQVLPPTGLVLSPWTQVKGMGACCQTVTASSPGVEWWVHLSLQWQ